MGYRDITSQSAVKPVLWGTRAVERDKKRQQELEQLQERLQPYLKKVHEMHPDVNMIFFMLTNILTESTLLLCEGNGAEAMIREALWKKARKIKEA